MELIRALVEDLHDRITWRRWIEALVRTMPGEVGQFFRRWVIGGQFGRAGTGLEIYPGAFIVGPQNLSVGNNCRIGYNNTIQASGGVECGDDLLLGPDVKIWSLNHVTDRTDIPIWDQGYEFKKVVIGNGVWIGANAFIMPGADIGDHVIIAAGSVVSGKKVAPYSILAGNPARKIGSRKALDESMPGGGAIGRTSSASDPGDD
jgi:maltose O-acetyltransferase